jgi:hypothetical protein
LLQTACIAPQCRKVGGGLAVKQPQFAKLIPAQNMQPVPLNITQ